MSLLDGMAVLWPSVSQLRDIRHVLSQYESSFHWQNDVSPRLFRSIESRSVTELPRIVDVILGVLCVLRLKLTVQVARQLFLAELLERTVPIHRYLSLGHCMHFINSSIRCLTRLQKEEAVTLADSWVRLASENLPMITAIGRITWRESQSLVQIERAFENLHHPCARACVLYQYYRIPCATRVPDFIIACGQFLTNCTRKPPSANLYESLNRVRPENLHCFVTLMMRCSNLRDLSRHCKHWCTVVFSLVPHIRSMQPVVDILVRYDGKANKRNEIVQKLRSSVPEKRAEHITDTTHLPPVLVDTIVSFEHNPDLHCLYLLRAQSRNRSCPPQATST